MYRTGSNKLLILGCGYLTIVFCLLPYLSILGFDTDTQPNALLSSFALHFLIKKEKMPILIYYGYFILLVASVVLVISGFDTLNLKDWANYLSFALIISAVYLFLNYINGEYFLFFKSIIYLWLITGIIQFFVYPRFMTFLVYRTSGVLLGGRGITGLTPEPTYYGLTMLSFLVIYLMREWYKRDKYLGIIILFQILFLSRSSTAIMVLIFSILVYSLYLLFSLKLKTIFYISILLFTIVTTILYFKSSFSSTRLYTVYLLLSQNPFLIISRDYSVSERINHVIFPFIGSAENIFIPRGFGVFGNYIIEKSQSNEYRAFFSHPHFTVPGRIMNGFGKAFFELGIFGALIPFLIYYEIRRTLNTNYKVFGYIIFNILLCMSFIFTTSIVPFMIANMLLNSKEHLPHLQSQ